MNTKDTKKMTKRVLTGTVMSDKGNKTVVVEVRSVKTHPRYHKQYTVSKRYQAHDEKNEYKTGDAVRIEECRPLSKTKRFRVMEKLAKV